MTIIVGYQGIGKSSVCQGESHNIDLESRNFFVDGKRGDDWVGVYVNMAINLNNQGKNVFMSSHKAVREELKRRGQEFLCIFPEDTDEMKQFWIQRLTNRYNEEPTDKNFKALANAQQMYSENIQDLSQEDWTYVIKHSDLRFDDSMPFNLYWVINSDCNLIKNAHRFDGQYVVVYRKDSNELKFGLVDKVEDVSVYRKRIDYSLSYNEVYLVDEGSKVYKKKLVASDDSHICIFDYDMVFIDGEQNISIIDEQEYKRLIDEKWNAV